MIVLKGWICWRVWVRFGVLVMVLRVISEDGSEREM